MHLRGGEQETIVQIVREKAEQRTIRLNGFGPFFDGPLILSFDQKLLFLRKMIREFQRTSSFHASFGVIARVPPHVR